MNTTRRLLCAAALMLGSGLAQADAVQSLKDFVREVKSGRASFSQTVTAPDGKRKKTSSGTFEFQRPNLFRFQYQKPFEQLIVGDGQKVWTFDADLNQASSRRIGQALAGTPAALLAGGNIEKDFELKAQPAEGGLEWVLALPRQAEGNIQQLRVGFKGRELAALEVLDAFGQRSLMQLSQLQTNVAIGADRFRFEVPKGVDLLEQ
ncbi:outer membrane lipoprotein chaperone LolA [Pelomonas sp. APW6]|uniref:Outer-membrane lipoprotein carrier protein n=1 Tax=Roseateles subflavus TaxID=3053353 RepID=A0ABT7LMN5_9BURK|nr:outer membrane lipoprotein chaperone LolA [Pelomonas sp. APW6]MDL5034126.1 outer membrane lipoprotein chaperone LolA [Pelomonas sp. APW6]